MRRNRQAGGRARQTPGFLARLRRDARGNALVIMAMMLIPLAGLSGSAIDMGRLYAVKSRLQQACDAGVLAGRKFMDMTNTSDTLDSNAATRAQTFFGNNFNTGWFKTSAVSFTPTKVSGNLVAGTASATVPMTLMAMFGQPSKVVTVSCQARLDVADTDVIFVLDTTGSMACAPGDTDTDCDTYVNNAGATTYTRPADSALQAPSGQTGSANDSVAGYPNSTGYYVPEKTGSRIAAVRQAVVDFYTTVANNIAGTQTRVRYGFVTYSSTVNAGKAIMNASPSYMVGGSGTTGGKTWTYQSRFIDPNKTSQYQISQSSAYDSTTSANCKGSPRTPAAVAGQPYTFDSSSQATVVGKQWDTGKNQCLVTTTVYGPLWTYGPVNYDVSSFLTNASVTDPSKLDGTTKSSWQGCVEERDTTAGASSFTTTALPPDLDPDLIPSSSSSDATRWRPMWPEVIYWRNYVFTNPQSWYGNAGTVTDIADNKGDTDKTKTYAYWDGTSTYVPGAFSIFYLTQNGSANSLLKGGNAVCGKPIRRVSSMTLQDVTNYVNASDFRPLGGTYHDVGMIWGTRLLSTLGIFKNDLAPQVSGQPTNKVIVFLTDGAMSPSLTSYGTYGVEYFDKRVTNGDYSPPGAAKPNTQQTAYHNARFLAECAKARAMNISVWTVMITTATSSTSQLQQCATTSGQALVSSSGSDLSTKFKNIATQIAMLRISQ